VAAELNTAHGNSYERGRRRVVHGHPVKDVLVANPETAQRKPVQRAPPPRLNTAAVAGGPSSRRGVPRTPTEAEKANLLAYLEGVASEKREGGSGGVPI